MKRSGQMKKFIMIFLSVVCIAGVVALGWLIFNSKSIASIEIEGQIQTLYVAGQDIDFEDAKLKVTYKNGNVKYVNMTNKSVKISRFSTSLQTHGKMKIAYKSQMLYLDYDVIKAGMYYVSNSQSFYADGSTSDPLTYDAKSAELLLYIRDNGELDHYYLDGSGRYCMHDGSYDKSYKYEIVGDSLNAYLGSEDNIISIKADYSTDGSVAYKYTKVNTNSEGLNISKNVKTFSYYEMKSEEYRTITNSDVDLSRTSGVVGNVVTFSRNTTIKSANKTMFLLVAYDNDHFMHAVFVHICDEMITNNSLDTSEPVESDTMYIHYKKGAGHADAAIHYRVV